MEYMKTNKVWKLGFVADLFSLNKPPKNVDITCLETIIYVHCRNLTFSSSGTLILISTFVLNWSSDSTVLSCGGLSTKGAESLPAFPEDAEAETDTSTLPFRDLPS